MTNPIAILTDFGNFDPYVGIMKGVIETIAPGIRIIDLTHEIPSGDVFSGAFRLWQSFDFFPKGTVFLCVVDPGVGTPREPIIAEIADKIVIAPNNGLITFLPPGKVWEIANKEYGLVGVSSTFHGRDVFAPAAAYAALNYPAQTFGKVIQEPNGLAKPRLVIGKNHIEGQFLLPDKFGNMITSLGRFTNTTNGTFIQSWLSTGEAIKVDLKEAIINIVDMNLSIYNTFQEIPANSAGGIIGSTGLLEICANQLSAVDLLNLKVGDPVILRMEANHG